MRLYCLGSFNMVLWFLQAESNICKFKKFATVWNATRTGFPSTFISRFFQAITWSDPKTVWSVGILAVLSCFTDLFWLGRHQGIIAILENTVRTVSNLLYRCPVETKLRNREKLFNSGTAVCVKERYMFHIVLSR